MLLARRAGGHTTTNTKHLTGIQAQVQYLHDKEVPSQFSKLKKSQKGVCCGLGCKPTPERGLVGYTTSPRDFFAPFSDTSATEQGETQVQRSLKAPLLLPPHTRAEESRVKQHCGPIKRPFTFTPPEAERGPLQLAYTRLHTNW